jgi:hypothetical protein
MQQAQIHILEAVKRGANVSLFKKARADKVTQSIRVLQYEFNWDFRYGTDKCLEKIQSLGITKLKAGNCFAFVNGRKTRVRLLTLDAMGRPVSIFQGTPKGQSFDLRSLRYLPEAFNGPSLDIDTATSRFLDAFFAKRRNSKV